MEKRKERLQDEPDLGQGVAFRGSLLLASWGPAAMGQGLVFQMRLGLSLFSPATDLGMRELEEGSFETQFSSAVPLQMLRVCVCVCVWGGYSYYFARSGIKPVSEISPPTHRQLLVWAASPPCTYLPVSQTYEAQ